MRLRFGITTKIRAGQIAACPLVPLRVVWTSSQLMVRALTSSTPLRPITLATLSRRPERRTTRLNTTQLRLSHLVQALSSRAPHRLPLASRPATALHRGSTRLRFGTTTRSKAGPTAVSPLVPLWVVWTSSQLMVRALTSSTPLRPITPATSSPRQGRLMTPPSMTRSRLSRPAQARSSRTPLQLS